MLVNILFWGLLLSFVSVLWIAFVGYFFLSTQLRHSEMRWLLCGPPLSYIFFCFLCISVCVCQACVAHFCHSDVMCLQVCLCLCSLLVAVCSCALSFLH